MTGKVKTLKAMVAEEELKTVKAKHMLSIQEKKTDKLRVVVKEQLA